MPEFKEEEERRQKQKMDELAPYIEKAMQRKQWMRELTDDEIPTYAAYGAMIAEVDTSNLEGAARIRAERWKKMREVLAKV
jgi:hypothetical protein